MSENSVDDTRANILPSSPAAFIPTDDKTAGPSPGIALCLSGGGYRAMLFSLGSIIRLNELGILSQLRRISSVSGGSITSALLGLKWKRLMFVNGIATNLEAEVVRPIQGMASESIDVSSVLSGLLWFGTVSDRVTKKYSKHLFGEATLQDLPSDGVGPRFVINATNVQTGSLWRFSKPFMGDWQVGLVMNPTLPLARVVTASSAFPPVLSPCVIDVEPGAVGADPRAACNRPPFTTRVVLSDGGVYDNMGIETAWKRHKTVLVCDAGAKIPHEEEPKADWGRHSYRVLELVDNQVRSLRKRQIIEAFKDKSDVHDGAYWGIRTSIADYDLGDAFPVPHAKSVELAGTPTRLTALDRELQERLINWGYAVCDAAIRKHAAEYVASSALPKRLPYNRGV